MDKWKIRPQVNTSLLKILKTGQNMSLRRGVDCVVLQSLTESCLRSFARDNTEGLIFFLHSQTNCFILAADHKRGRISDI